MNSVEMRKEAIEKIPLLNQKNLQSLYDYLNFLLQKNEDKEVTQSMMKLAEEGHAFDFLNEDDDMLYKLEDLKERFR